MAEISFIIFDQKSVEYMASPLGQFAYIKKNSISLEQKEILEHTDCLVMFKNGIFIRSDFRHGTTSSLR